MGNVNSQGLTWLEWRNAAAIGSTFGIGRLTDSEWQELRQAWKAGVDPAEYRSQMFDDLADIAANRGRTEDPETGRWE